MKPSEFDYRLWKKDENIYLSFDKDQKFIPRNDNIWVIELWSRFYDKNGIKIFENDIVKITDTEDNSIQINRIIFNSLGFLLETGSNLSDYYHRRYVIEVLGNIHENPEIYKDI